MPVSSYRLCSVVVAYPSVAAWSDPSFLHVANYKAFCCLPMLKVQMKQVQNNKQFVSNKSCRRGVDIWFWVNLPAPCFLTYDDIYVWVFLIIFYFICVIFTIHIFRWWSRRYRWQTQRFEIYVFPLHAIVHPILILLRLDTHQVGPCK